MDKFTLERDKKITRGARSPHNKIFDDEKTIKVYNFDEFGGTYHFVYFKENIGEQKVDKMYEEYRELLNKDLLCIYRTKIEASINRTAEVYISNDETEGLIVIIKDGKIFERFVFKDIKHTKDIIDALRPKVKKIDKIVKLLKICNILTENDYTDIL